jgi:anti-sigma regulatory factor (Ser/Thr protein kinase)
LPEKSGGAWSLDLAIEADYGEAGRASKWLESACAERGVPSPQVDRLVLCLNEVLANVVRHGGSTATSEPIALRLEVRSGAEGNEASVTVSDAGREFDPVSAPRRPPPRSLEEAAPNGMGLGILDRCSDFRRYRREGGRNHLTFAARWPS